MKRIIVILCVFALATAGVSAQTLLDNSYYQMGEELLAQAEESYEEGDYDAAAEYAAQAEEYFAMSDEYVDQMVLYQEAQVAVAKAEARMEWAKAEGAEENYPEAYASSQDSLDAALQAMSDEEYELAILYANASVDALAEVGGAKVLPASYKVVLNPALRDCLWRIAALSAIYGDPLLWEKLYEANRAKLVDPNNPDLIVPGQVLSVPSLYGEKREGQYVPGTVYLELPKKK